MKSSQKGILFIILACLCWASDSYFRYPLIQKNIDPIQLVFAEHTLLMFFFFYTTIRSLIISAKNFTPSICWYFFIVGGVGSALSTVFFSKAMLSINPAVVIIMQKLQPLFALIFAKLILKEKLPWNFMKIMALAILGLILLSYPDLRGFSWKDFESFGTDKVWGYIFALLSVLGWSLATVYGKKIFNKSSEFYNEWDVMSLRYLFGWIVLSFYLSFFEKDPFVTVYHSLSSELLPLFSMVLLSAIVGMSLYYKGIKILRPRLIVMAELWYPFLAIVVSAVLLKAPLEIIQLIGGVLIVAVTWMSQTQKTDR